MPHFPAAWSATFRKTGILAFPPIPGEIVWHSGHKSGIKWRWKKRSADNLLAGAICLIQTFS
jgi:hypothetical protein